MATAQVGTNGTVSGAILTNAPEISRYPETESGGISKDSMHGASLLERRNLLDLAERQRHQIADFEQRLTESLRRAGGTGKQIDELRSDAQAEHDRHSALLAQLRSSIERLREENEAVSQRRNEAARCAEQLESEMEIHQVRAQQHRRSVEIEVSQLQRERDAANQVQVELVAEARQLQCAFVSGTSNGDLLSEATLDLRGAGCLAAAPPTSPGLESASVDQAPTMSSWRCTSSPGLQVHGTSNSLSQQRHQQSVTRQFSAGNPSTGRPQIISPPNRQISAGPSVLRQLSADRLLPSGVSGLQGGSLSSPPVPQMSVSRQYSSHSPPPGPSVRRYAGGSTPRVAAVPARMASASSSMGQQQTMVAGSSSGSRAGTPTRRTPNVRLNFAPAPRSGVELWGAHPAFAGAALPMSVPGSIRRMPV